MTTTQASPFFEQPILNSPYEEPTRHHPLEAEGQPLNEPPREGRRKSELITPVPKPRKKKRKSTNLYETDPAKSHINYVVCDSDWEAEFARAAEQHPRVLSYVKNQGLGLEVPSDRGMDRKSDHGSVRLGTSTPLFDP